MLTKHYLIVFLLIFTFQASYSQVPAMLEKFDKAIQNEPKEANNYVERAHYFMANNYHRNAVRDLDKALLIDEKKAGIYLLRGKAKLAIEDYSGAINDFNRALYLQPDLAEAFYMRGVIRKMGKDMSGACDDFKKAKALGYTQNLEINCP